MQNKMVEINLNISIIKVNINDKGYNIEFFKSNYVVLKIYICLEIVPLACTNGTKFSVRICYKQQMASFSFLPYYKYI